MKDFDELVNKFTIKRDRLIKRVCAPLKDNLGIPIFGYYSIEKDGRFGMLSDFPEQLEFFFSEGLHLSHPYLKDPTLFRSGFTMSQPTYEADYLEMYKKQFLIKDLFLIIERNGEILEGFIFATPLTQKENIDFLDHADLLKKFSQYFKREAKPLIEQMNREGYNLKNAKGNAFAEVEFPIPLLSSDPKVAAFLKTITPLSAREYQCLELYKQGHSAQATGAILRLSERTVEHYFESIKNKLGCQSKRELLNY